MTAQVATSVYGSSFSVRFTDLQDACLRQRPVHLLNGGIGLRTQDLIMSKELQAVQCCLKLETCNATLTVLRINETLMDSRSNESYWAILFCWLFVFQYIYTEFIYFFLNHDSVQVCMKTVVQDCTKIVWFHLLLPQCQSIIPCFLESGSIFGFFWPNLLATRRSWAIDPVEINLWSSFNKANE